MKSFIWSNDVGEIRVGDRKAVIVEKPKFTFRYIAIFFEPEADNEFYISTGTKTKELNSAQCVEIMNFIEGFDAWPVKQAHGIGELGQYLGYGPETEFSRVVENAPPVDGRHYYWSKKIKDWVQSIGVDLNGNWIGNAPIEKLGALVERRPREAHWTFDFKTGEYADKRPIEVIKLDYCGRIDDAISSVRSATRTVAQGQDFIYSLKVAEARRYIESGRPSEVGDYPALSADSEIFTIPVSQAADRIMKKYNETVDYELKLERTRLNAKQSIRLATDWNSIVLLYEIAKGEIAMIRESLSQ